ncbi:uncharacterized protein L201_001064 [Kwoniella dendrophila CBS 6074]|uniref:Uncharacterized protein n=1 Tax=Kwoniella dendrophila CBS 6074 TaxID=1295534 RepID=A0AAX4JL95_9TREE
MTNIPLPIQKKLESSLSMPKWVSNATQIKVETTKAFQQLPDHTIIIKTPFERFPVDETKSAPISEVIVKLGRPKGNGYLWDVYEATIQDPNTGNSLNNVVAKYTLPFTFGGLEYYDDWPSEDQSKQGIAFEAITREHEMYTEHLVDLQGTDIPIHYGTFKNSKRKAFCMILEDVGKPIGKIPALWTLTEPEK